MLREPIPEVEAKPNEGRPQKGGIHLSVHCDTAKEIKRAKGVLKLAGGEDVAFTEEATVDPNKTDSGAAAKT
jgi:hypothetical protein